jgi:prefoldin subunit 5
MIEKLKVNEADIEILRKKINEIIDLIEDMQDDMDALAERI